MRFTAEMQIITQYEYKNNMYRHCKDMQKRAQMQHNYTEMCLVNGML